WSLLEDKTVHILDMNENYLRLVNFLADASANLPEFMSGSMQVFGEKTVIKKDAIYESLVKDWEGDDKVEVYLSVGLPALGDLSRKLFKDHLPGGRWENTTQEMRQKCSGTQKHNKFSESVFGFLDQLLRKKPNISVLSSEAYVMFTANKTKQWLESKDENKQQRLVTLACRDMNKVRENFKTRKLEILQKQQQMLREKMEKVEELELKRVARLQGFTDKIIYYGLWQSIETVDAALRETETRTEQKEALKAQMNFRKHVLKQTPPKTVPEYDRVLLFSKIENNKTKDLSVEELSENVKKLVQHAFTIADNKASEVSGEHFPLLVGKTVSHKFHEGDEVVWYRGKVISQVMPSHW
ncbi:MAG: hypothetical protein AB2708_14345, partial [Candidatus Thiodiazotropha taylori]